MKTVKPVPLVLEDAGGKVIRSFNWSQPKIYLVRTNRTGRLEALANSTEVRKKNSNFTLIKCIHLETLGDSKLSVGNIGFFRRLQPQEEIQYHESPLEKDSDEDFHKTLRWSAYLHAAILMLTFSLYWGHKLLFEDDTPVVKIEIPKTATPIPQAKPKKVFKASNKKINRKKKVIKKARQNPKVAKSKAKKSVNKMGALAALGGTSGGSQSGRGLKLKSALKNSGSGDSMGTKSLGDATTSFAGKGLSANSGGGGKTNLGGVGYGTKGRSGGQAGYGKLNIGGSSGGYEHPMQEDGTIDGGLEMSQIEAVIKRNLGQIFYCYEKGLQAKPKLSGRVAVNFIINSGGRVQLAQVGRTSLNSASVEACMIGKIKAWKFPRPHGNVDVNVSYPFILRRARHG